MLRDRKSKFRQTEVGMIPEDWEVKLLGDSFSFSGGYVASRDQLSEDGFCYLHYGDIHGSTKQYVDVATEFSAIPKLNIKLSNVSRKSLLSDGDIVFVDASEDDEGTSKHVVVRNHDGIPYISGLHTIVLKSKDDSFDLRYKEYCFQTNDIKRQFKFYAVGTKVSGISKTNLAKIFIPRPPKLEQKAIAENLSEIDALIASFEKLIAKKRAIKQGAMQELLTGKRRLPGFKGKWTMRNLADIVVFANGKPYEKYVTRDGRYNLITLDSIDINGKLKDEHRRVDFCDGSLQKDDIVIILSDIAHGNFLGLCDLIPHNDKYVLNQRVARLRAIADDPQYIRLQINIRQSHFRIRGQGTSQRHVYKRDIDALEIPFPSTKAEQIAIAQVHNDIDTEINKMEQQLIKYKMLKQGMMQALLTGRIRLV